jgi:hypothetical protein
MTVKEYADRLNELYTFVGGDITDLVILSPATKMLREIKRRVVQDGANTSLEQIGNYSTKPISVTKEQFINKGVFNPTDIVSSTIKYKVGGKTRKRTVQKKTMFLRNGYKELRDIQGLQTAFIDLKYSGKMVRAFQLAKGENAVLMGITTQRSAKIYKDLVRRFGQFYQPTAAEQKEYLDRTTFLANRLFRDVINGNTITPTIEQQ